MSEWRRNPGFKPEEAHGKRVAVKLENGQVCGEVPVSSGAKAGWDADRARWSRDGAPFDIVEYRVL